MVHCQRKATRSVAAAIDFAEIRDDVRIVPQNVARAFDWALTHRSSRECKQADHVEVSTTIRLMHPTRELEARKDQMRRSDLACALRRSQAGGMPTLSTEGCGSRERVIRIRWLK